MTFSKLLRFPAFVSCHPVVLGIGDAVVFRSFLLFSVAPHPYPITSPNKIHWFRKLDFGSIGTCTAMGSLCGWLDMHLCGVNIEKVYHKTSERDKINDWAFNKLVIFYRLDCYNLSGPIFDFYCTALAKITESDVGISLNVISGFRDFNILSLALLIL